MDTGTATGENLVDTLAFSRIFDLGLVASFFSFLLLKTPQEQFSLF
jgi:hypothetical protein